MIFNRRKLRESLTEGMRIQTANEYANGKSSKEIADEFGVSESTVRKLAKEIRYYERKNS